MNPNYSSHPNRTRRLKGAAVVAGAVGSIGMLLGGVDTVANTVDNVRENDRQFVEHPSRQPDQAESQAIEAGIAGMQEKLGADAPQVGGQPAAESTPPTSIHTYKDGDTNWDVAAEAQKRGLIDGEIRPVVDDLQAQDPTPTEGEKVTVTLNHPAPTTTSDGPNLGGGQ